MVMASFLAAGSKPIAASILPVCPGVSATAELVMEYPAWQGWPTGPSVERPRCFLQGGSLSFFEKWIASRRHTFHIISPRCAFSACSEVLMRCEPGLCVGKANGHRALRGRPTCFICFRSLAASPCLSGDGSADGGQQHRFPADDRLLARGLRKPISEIPRATARHQLHQTGESLGLLRALPAAPIRFVSFCVSSI